MRIVVAHDAIGTDGGVETYLLSVTAELRRRGHQVALAFCSGAPSSLLLSSAQTAFRIDERTLDPAIAEIGRWQPDVCFSHNMAPLHVDRALIGKWPVVKMLHGFFGTCVSGLKMHAWPAPEACHRTFGPACLALYVPRRCGQLSAGALVRGYAWARDQRSLFSRYASIVVASRFMSDEMVKQRRSRGSRWRAAALLDGCGRAGRRRRRTRHAALCRTHDAAQGRTRADCRCGARGSDARAAGAADHGRRRPAEG